MLLDLPAITVNRGRVIVMKKSAGVPQASIKPNKKLIVTLALVLVGMEAVLFVLIRRAVRNRV